MWPWKFFVRKMDVSSGGSFDLVNPACRFALVVIVAMSHFEPYDGTIGASSLIGAVVLGKSGVCVLR